MLSFACLMTRRVRGCVVGLRVHHPGASSVRVCGRPQRHLKVGRCVPRALHNAYIAWCSANVVYKRCNEYGRIYCMSVVRCVRVWVAKIWSRGTHYDWIIIGLNIFISKLIVKFSLYLPSFIFTFTISPRPTTANPVSVLGHILVYMQHCWRKLDAIKNTISQLANCTI